MDYKGQLQEIAQAHHQSVCYRMVAVHGPAHCQRFEVDCTVSGHYAIAGGFGTSKKQAEQEAASMMIAVLEG